MSTWDSAYLLSMFNRKAGRPTTDAITTVSKYERLSEAQNRVIAKMAAVCPDSLYPHVATASLPQLTVSSAGDIATFGTDSNGYSNFPMGKGGIFSSLNDIPTNPLRPGVDYMIEGTQIRSMNNTVLPATLYWYGIAQPADITASVQPALTPEASRVLVVIEAVREFAQENLRNASLVDEMDAEWERQWPEWCLTWKTQFRKGGALNVYAGWGLSVGGWYQGQWAT